MASNHTKTLLKDYDRITLQLEKAFNIIENQNNTISLLKAEIKTLTALVAKKDEQIEQLILEIERLKNNNNKDSSNSSKPSSKDGFKKIKNSREKTDKKQGGQKGHKGETLDVSTIKNLIDSGKVKCAVINVNKNHKNKGKQYITRYVQDVVISTVIREYRYYPNNKGSYSIPKEQNNIVTYGNNIKAIGMLLVHRVPASMDQSVNFFDAITNGNFKITKSTLNNWTCALSEKLEPLISEIHQGLFNSYYVNTDESPINVNGKNHQVHSYSNEKYTLQYAHEKKSKEAMIELGFLPKYIGTLIHDHNMVQYNFGTRHGECNAHILRYLKATEEFSKHKWPSEMSVLLKEILRQKHLLLGKKIFRFDKVSLDTYSQDYDDILQSASKEYLSDLKTNPYKDDEKKLITRLKEYKENHLLFMFDFNIPFTNNRAETDIRPTKRKQNVGIFRSINGATYYLKIRSSISTFLKNNLDVFEMIKNAFGNKKVSLNLG